MSSKKVRNPSKPLIAPTPNDGKFHLIKSVYAANSLTRALKSGHITEDDKILIEKHVAWLGRGNISICRLNKITFHLVGARRFIGTFRNNTFDDLIMGINRLKNDEIMTIATAGKDAQPYKQNTKRDFVSIVKKFYLWLVKKNYSAIAKDDIEDIQVPSDDTMTKTAAQMFDEEEIRAMITECRSSMERAMALTWGQVSFNEQTVVINVNVKTNIPRRIPLFSARPYLATWKSDYPYNMDANALVFVNAQNHNFTYATITKRIRAIAARAGIEKKVTLHIFRHSRITNMKKQGISEQTIKKIAWGNQTTKMLATYDHCDDQDVDSELAAKNGISEVNKGKSHVMNPRQCAHCGNVNSPTSNYCGICSLPLTPEEKLTSEQLAIELQNTPIYKMLMEELRKKVSSGAFAVA